MRPIGLGLLAAALSYFSMGQATAQVPQNMAATVEASRELPSKMLVGYWHNFDNGSGFIRLRDVSPAWDLIHVAFAESGPDLSSMNFVPYGQSVEDFKRDIKELQARGKKVAISIGGANSIVKLPDEGARDRFVTTMTSIIHEYGFDGLDIDLEGASLSLDAGDGDFREPKTPAIRNLIQAVRTLKARFGPQMLLTMAPETYYVQVGLAAYGGAAGAYLPVIYALRDILNFIHVQHYNTGSVEALDGRAYSAGTADFQVAMVDMLLKGFPVGRNPNAMFPALRPEQVVIGLPSAPSAAGSGYTPPGEVQKAFAYLAQGKSWGGAYKTSGSYPNLRGLMAWSINWDAHHQFGFTKPHRGFLDELKAFDRLRAGPALNANKPIVGAYFVEWGVYGRNYGVEKIPFAQITHLLYSFVPICGSNESLQIANPSGHALLLQECSTKKKHEITIHDVFAATQPPHNSFAKLAKAKADHPHVKILPSIGGWTLSDAFHEMAATRENRATFIASCLRFLDQWTFFDGLDLDWEYPGGGGANSKLGTAADRQNHVLLMQELRAALDAHGKAKNRTFLLTSAVGAAPAKIDFVDYKALFSNPDKPLLDLIFAMTYDFYGAWNGVRSHTAGLYDGEQAFNNDLSGAAAIENLMAAGVPAKNLVLGVAMYGRAWQDINSNSSKGLSLNETDDSGRAMAMEAGMWEPGVLDYKLIASSYRHNPAYQFFYDKKAEAPYLWSPGLKKLITYDDVCSTRAKLKFAEAKGLAGTFAWELDADNGDILSVMNGSLPSNCP